jgi:hypothetical protein
LKKKFLLGDLLLIDSLGRKFSVNPGSGEVLWHHYCECGQLETVEHVLKKFPLHSAERDYLRKVSPELDPKILLDTKKGLGAVVKFLDSLPQLLC